MMFIGRARELTHLRGLLDQARQGTGSIALISGEAGIGKSRLVEQLLDEAQTFTTLTGRCFKDTGQSAFGPWREALSDSAIFKQREALGAREDRARTFEAVLSNLESRTPVLVVIEDLHWADHDSCLLFQHVARFGLRASLLLIGTLRTPDLDGARNETLDEVLDELLRSPACTRLALKPFAEEEVAAYATAIARAAVPQAVARAIHRESGGNALYVRELTHHLLEEGKVSTRDGRLGTDFATSELALPPSIRHLARRRVARLSPPAAALLRAAAIAGAPIAATALARAAELDLDRALDAIDESIAAGLLLAKGARYELAHAIIGRAIQEDLNPDRRSRLHRALAEALETEPSADRGELAAHYFASRELPGAERGLAHALAAADQARATGAHEREATFLDLAMQLSPNAHLARALAIARARAIDLPGTLSALAQAEQLLDTAEAPAMLADVARELSLGGAPRESWDPLVARGLALLGDRRDLIWARLELLSSKLLPVLEGPSDGAYVSGFGGFDREAVRILREQGTELDFASTVEPQDARAREESRALRDRTTSWKQPAAIIRVLDACTRDLFFRDCEFTETLAAASELLALAERVGSPGGQVSALVVLGCTHAALGDFERARETTERARTIGTRLGSMHRMNVIGPHAAATILGYFTDADWANTTRPLLDLIRSPKSAATPFGAVALALGMFGAALSGDHDTARKLLPLNMRTLEALPALEWGAWRDVGASVVWILRERAYAEAHLQLALASRDRPAGACFSCADETAARMCALLGDLPRAMTFFESARASFDRSSRAPSRAIVDHDEAQALLLAGRSPDDARVAALLDEAERRFRALGMDRWLASTNALRARPAEPPDGLSKRELEVLRLLARGLANKEIAAQLFISVPTVERHVANIYGKIGASGRAAATAYALRHKLV